MKKTLIVMLAIFIVVGRAYGETHWEFLYNLDDERDRLRHQYEVSVYDKSLVFHTPDDITGWDEVANMGNYAVYTNENGDGSILIYSYGDIELLYKKRSYRGYWVVSITIIKNGKVKTYRLAPVI